MAERVSFASSRGPILAGLLDVPPGAARGWGVFAHGFALSKDSPAAARTCRSFVALEGSDHLLAATGQAQRAARIISAWTGPIPRRIPPNTVMDPRGPQ